MAEKEFLGIGIRTYILGILLTLLVCGVLTLGLGQGSAPGSFAPFNGQSYSLMGSLTSMIPVALVAPIVMIAILLALISRFAPKLKLNAREYGFLIASLLIGIEINNYEAMYGWIAPYVGGLVIDPYKKDLFDIIHPLFAPKDPKVLEGFLNGGVPVPWDAWATPLAFAISYLLAFGFFTLLIGEILRKPYLEVERLPYPASQLLTVTVKLSTETAGERPVARIFKEKIFWVGALVGFAFYQQALFAEWFAYFTGMAPAAWPSLMAQPAFAWYHELTLVYGKYLPGAALSISFYPPMWAVAYYLPLNILFSTWFFYVLCYIIIAPITVAAGLAPYDPSWAALTVHGNYSWTYGAKFGYLSNGVLIALALWPFIVHRKFIVGYFKQAFGASSGAVSEIEAHPRIVIPLFIISIIGMLALPMAVSVPFHVSLLMLIFLAIWTLGWIRVVGYTTYAIPRTVGTYTKFILSDALGGIGGTPAVSTAILFDQTFSHGLPWGNPGPLYQFACAAGYDLGLRPKDMFIGACIGLIISSLIGFPLFLTGVYSFGMNVNVSAGWLFRLYGSWTPDSAVKIAVTDKAWPRPPGIYPDVNVVIGIIIGAILLFLSGRFAWWPLHPVGFFLGVGYWDTVFFWFPFFLAWLAKFLILRIGGVKVHEKYALPFITGFLVAAYSLSWLGAASSWLRSFFPRA
ncbi:MAG: DUF6785 family protein [Candidatus Bathyarchaeia archaeon]